MGCESSKSTDVVQNTDTKQAPIPVQQPPTPVQQAPTPVQQPSPPVVDQRRQSTVAEIVKEKEEDAQSGVVSINT